MLGVELLLLLLSTVMGVVVLAPYGTSSVTKITAVDDGIGLDEVLGGDKDFLPWKAWLGWLWKRGALGASLECRRVPYPSN